MTPGAPEKRRALILGGITDRWHRFIHVGPVMQKVLQWHGIVADLTEDVRDISADNLSKYDAVINYTTFREFEPAHIQAFQNHLSRGGGHVALHGASATAGDAFDEYNRLIGAKFVEHPPICQFDVRVVDGDHPITVGLPRSFTVIDEPYVLDRRGDAHLLMEAEVGGEVLPVAWTKKAGSEMEPDGGSVFYLALGHDMEQWRNPIVQYIFIRAVQWSTGAPRTF